jgi:hypothetical protein
MNEFAFLFAIHNHQPVGNFPSVFEKAFKECYFPFLEEIEKHPSVKFTVHFSGPLWEYMAVKERTCWELIKIMSKRGQMELLGGGFYEPVLSIIPEADRQGQLALMTAFLEENFSQKPRGIWLTERVWEPALPKTLHQAGIEYTLLDEEHFHYSGVRDIHSYYLTESEGHPLKIFPIDKKLRYAVPFRPIEEIKSHFDDIRKKGGVAILGDDGEKFGLWPGTHEWVYEKGWLKEFLNFLEIEGIRTSTYSEALEKCTPAGKVYLPPASYEEMMEWTLEPDEFDFFRELKKSSPARARRFLRGGIFPEYFLKYRESDHLHKRMLMVSEKVNRGQDEAAIRELYKGQGNDPYWHGVFGGLYLPHLRETAYYHLLQAEKRLFSEPGWRETDYDRDGRTEVFYEGETFNLLLKPSLGGAVVELDYKPLARNLTNVLSRRKEPYHRKEEVKKEGKSIHDLAKELPAEASALLRYDWHARHTLLDHFLHPRTTPEEFARIDYGEQGDFVNQAYQFKLINDALVLSREGKVWAEGERIPVLVRKEIHPRRREIRVNYLIENNSERELPLVFGSEWNLYQIPDEIQISKNRISLAAGKLLLEADSADEIWQFPLQTLSQSEKGFDIIHQGFCLLALWRKTLSGKASAAFSLILREDHGQ